MGSPFVSVHMIAKENTNLGSRFLDSCFMSLHEAQYPNEIVFINNGCANFIMELVRDYWVSKFKEFDCELKIIDFLDNTDFCNLRNQCIFNTYENAHFMHWIDTDEVYYPEDLDVLKNHIMSDTVQISMIWTFFYHFIIDPFNVQADNKKTKKDHELGPNDIRSIKDNVFGFHKGIRWRQEEKVHEHIDRKKEGVVLEASDCCYLHYGYIRHQWRIFLKWLHYAKLEFGNVNCYKLEGDPKREYFREDNIPTPNTIIEDRKKITVPYPNRVSIHQNLPEGAIKLINGCKNEQEWLEYLNKLDGNEFWLRWEDLYKKKGKWSETLDEILEECEKCNWSLV